MAADKLLVSTEEMTATAGTFKSCLQEMQNAYLTMSDAVRTLDGSWDGDASEQFKTSFANMYNNLSQTEAKMTDAVDEMLKAAELFEEVENSIKTAAAGLDVGTSPFA